MAYSNIPVGSASQILQELASFAAANGWEVVRDEADPENANFWVITLKDTNGVYLSIAANATSLYLNGHRGFSGQSGWNNQVDQFWASNRRTHTECELQLPVSPLSIHIFAGVNPSPYLYVAIELEPGFYRHIIVCEIEKFGASTGGLMWDVASTSDTTAYGSSVNHNKYPMLIHQSQQAWSYRTGGLDTQNSDGVRKWGLMGAPLPTDLPNHIRAGSDAQSVATVAYTAGIVRFNNRSVLYSPLVYVEDAGNLYPIGTAPNLRYINLELYQAGDEITLGQDIWKVFPLIRKGPEQAEIGNTDPSLHRSRNLGIAYLKA